MNLQESGVRPCCRCYLTCKYCLFMSGLVALLCPLLLSAGPFELPQGEFRQKNGQLTISIQAGNKIRIQRIPERPSVLFTVKTYQKVRNEYWCIILKKETLPESSTQKQPNRVSPNPAYKKQEKRKENKKKSEESKNQSNHLVLGHKEAKEEPPVAPLLPELSPGTRIIFMYTSQGLELLVLVQGERARHFQLERSKSRQRP